MKLSSTAYALVIIGALNWLLLGLLSWEIGSLFGGPSAWFSRVIYILIGLSGLYLLFAGKKSSHSGHSESVPM